MMRTIKAILSDAAVARKADSEIYRDERIERVYAEHPALERIDSALLKCRRDRIIRIIESGEDPQTMMDSRMREILDKRRAYIISNGIDEHFDEAQPICPICKDTFFIQKNSIKVICKCMRDSLLEAYSQAGLTDYNSVVPTAFKADYIEKFAARRTDVYKTFARMLSTINEGKTHPIYLYYDEPQTGKTFISVVSIKNAISLGIDSAYVKCDDLTYSSEDTMNFYKSVQFLVIDDYLGAVTTGARNVGRVLNSILETRMNRGLATVIVTNEDFASAIRNSDERIASKLKRASKI